MSDSYRTSTLNIKFTVIEIAITNH